MSCSWMFSIQSAQNNTLRAHVDPTCVLLGWFPFGLSITTQKSCMALLGPTCFVLGCFLFRLHAENNIGHMWGQYGLFTDEFLFWLHRTTLYMGPMCGRHVLYGDDFYSDCSELATPIRPNVLGWFLFKTIPGKHGAQVGSTFVVLGRFLSETCPEKKNIHRTCVGQT